MRNTYLKWALALLIILSLAACQGESKDEPSLLDAPIQEAARQTQTAQARPTNTPWPTAWPTNTPFVRQTPVPSRTPIPTPDLANSTEEPFDNYVVPGDWLYETFTTSSGDVVTFEDFLGRAVIFETLASTCQMCIEQQDTLLQAAQDRYDQGQLGDTVFIALDVNPAEPLVLLSDVLERQLADQWSTVELLRRDDIPADYIIASAGEDLIAALERDFGPDISQPIALTVIAIAPDGLAHLLPEGMVNFQDLRTAIQVYGNPPEQPAN